MYGAKQSLEQQCTDGHQLWQAALVVVHRQSYHWLMLRCRRLQEIAQEFSGSGQGTCTKLRDQTNKFDDRGTNPFPVPLNTSQEIMLYWIYSFWGRLLIMLWAVGMGLVGTKTSRQSLAQIFVLHYRSKGSKKTCMRLTMQNDRKPLLRETVPCELMGVIHLL